MQMSNFVFLELQAPAGKMGSDFPQNPPAARQLRASLRPAFHGDTDPLRFRYPLWNYASDQKGQKTVDHRISLVPRPLPRCVTHFSTLVLRPRSQRYDLKKKGSVTEIDRAFPFTGRRLLEAPHTKNTVLGFNSRCCN